MSDQGNRYNDSNKSVMSLGDWLVTFLVLIVPFINIIVFLGIWKWK